MWRRSGLSWDDVTLNYKPDLFPQYLASHIGEHTDPGDLPLANSLDGFFFFFGAAIYSYEGISVVSKRKQIQNTNKQKYRINLDLVRSQTFFKVGVVKFCSQNRYPLENYPPPLLLREQIFLCGLNSSLQFVFII